SSVENLVPNPSESEGENGCDVPACFTTFSNVLFDADYDFYSVDDQSLFDEDFLKEIFSNPLFEEEIISMKIDPHRFNAESDLIDSPLNHDSSITPSSSKIDSLLDEFVGELILLKSIPDILIYEELLDNHSLSLPEKSPDLLSLQGLEIFQPSAKWPIMIHGKNIPILDVPLFPFYLP
nr:hypothetical protein [Tanacetum cinerariifolium]